MSFHELQELLLLSHDDGVIDDDELLLLYEEFSPKNPDFSYENYGRLDLQDINDSECLAEFRVKKRDLPFFLLKHSKYLTVSHAVKEVL